MDEALLARMTHLEREVQAIRRSMKELDSRLDTAASPPWKKVCWFLLGYRWWTVGRWYAAPHGRLGRLWWRLNGAHERRTASRPMRGCYADHVQH